MNKKIITGVVSLIVLVAICAGGYYLLSRNQNDTPSQTNQPQVQTANNNQTANPASSNSLVVYFSVPETDDPNKQMTTEEENSAIVVDNQVLGNTQYVAMLISEYTGADIYRIEPETPYTTNHDDLVDLAQQEQNRNARPAIRSSVSNFDDYDTIYIGYPIWWSDMPQILYTFMEAYDFSGKTVIPFSTHGGSGLSGTVNTIRNTLGNATVEENAFTISRNNMERASSEVNSWLKEIGRIQ